MNTYDNFYVSESTLAASYVYSDLSFDDAVAIYKELPAGTSKCFGVQQKDCQIPLMTEKGIDLVVFVELPKKFQKFLFCLKREFPQIPEIIDLTELAMVTGK